MGMGDLAFIVKGYATGLAADTLYTVWTRQLNCCIGSNINQYAPLNYYLLDSFTTDSVDEGDFYFSVSISDWVAGTYNI